MKCTVKGNIGNNATLTYKGEGEDRLAICEFWLCENRKKRDGSVLPVWTKVTLWNKYAEAMAHLLTKGRFVMVEGEPSEGPRTYTNKNNQIVAYNNLNTNVDITFLDRPVTAGEEDAPWAAEEAEAV